MAGIEKSDKATHQPSHEDEERFRSLFMECPVSLWEEDITGLAAYLDSLRSSGITDLRAYFDQHPDEIIRRVSMIKVLEVNKATLDLFEAPDMNSLLANLSSIFSEESRATYREILVALTEGRRVFDTETVCRTLRGKILHINLKWSLLPDSGGKLNRALVAITDITDRKRSEEEVGMLKRSIDGYYDGAYWIDSDNKFVYVNDAGCEALGYEREELIGKSLDEVNPRVNAERMKEVWAGLRHGGSFSKESVHRRKDGSEFPVEVVNTYVRFGGKEYVCGFARDITERKETEQLLQRQRAQLEEAQRISKVGSWERDISTNAVTWSDELTRIFGINPREQRPTFQMLLDIMHPDDREPFQKAVREAVFEKKPYSFEYRIVLGDGSIRFIHARGEAQYDGAGRPLIFRGTAQDITERKQMEKALHSNKERLDFLLSSSPAVIYTSRTEGDFGATFISDNVRTLLGYEPSQFIEDPRFWADHIHPDDAPHVFAALPRLFDQGRHSHEYRFRHNDGTYRWMYDDLRLVRDALGKPMEIIGYWVDISERKKVEEALLDSEMRYRTLFEQSGDYIIVMKIGKDGVPVITDTNETTLRAHGYSREEVVGRPIDVLDPVTDVDVHNDRVIGVKKGNLELFTTQHRRKDGSLFDVEVRAQLVSIGGEQVIVSTERDITDRKRAEEKLRQNEEFIRNILDTVDEGFIVIDRDYRIVTANKAYCASASCDNVIGKHCYKISHRRTVPCYDAGEECAVRTVFETGRPHVSNHTHQDDEGRLIYVETKAFPLKDSSGNVISAIETINDITEKHLLEEERLKTQKLEAIGTLAGGIAHDFNNLLQGVFGYISLAKLSADRKEKSVAALEQAEKALHLSVNLTSQLLTFSKGGKPVKQRIDLRPVIENAARFALSGSRSDHLLKISDDLWDADADSGQIGQVIQNIVLNADQAMPEGGHVEIQADNVQTPDNLPQGLEDGRYVRISIRDNGVGIPEQYLAKIFDPYFTTKEKGSGLGLATSYSIIKNHGGVIDLHSLPGKGSTFFVYIPAAAPMATIPVVDIASRPARTGRILVMDDDEVVRLVAGELIRALGHDADFAEHGDAALIKYKAAREAGDPFDVVIMDLTVRGGMGGVETLQKIREIDPDVKAVVSSGYSDNAMAAEYQKIGFRSFLKKPYHIEELRDMLNALLM